MLDSLADSAGPVTAWFDDADSLQPDPKIESARRSSW
jgi:hypothetical protein